MGPITREEFDRWHEDFIRIDNAKLYEPDHIECRTLPMEAVRRIAAANHGAVLILHRWQWDLLHDKED